MLIVIACHGKTGGDLCTSDGRRVKLSELQELVNGEEAPAFRNCPKLFLLSACRGDARKGDSDDEEENLNVDSVTSAHTNQTIISTSATDYFTAYSTVENYVSYRHIQKGSTFIQTVCDVWENNFYSLNINDLMTQVNF